MYIEQRTTWYDYKTKAELLNMELFKKIEAFLFCFLVIFHVRISQMVLVH